MAASADQLNEEKNHLTTSVENSDDSNVEIKIALVGQTGSGKSSYINALRGLDEDDVNAAKTGDGNTTDVPQSFVHPEAYYIKIWDQPGHSTPSHSQIKTYSKFLSTGKYDAFLLFTKGCLTDNDIRLAKTIVSLKKPLFLVRTNIDYDFYNKSRKATFDEKKMLDQIKSSLISNLEKMDCSCVDQIFLISNIQPSKWDFNLLTDKVVELGLRLSDVKKKDTSKKNLSEMVETFMKKGYEATVTLMDERLGAWEKIIIKLAVIGDSGVGKSSFINAIRGVKVGEAGAADVGTEETTTISAEYPYPGNQNISLFDIPGIGSDTYPDVKTYASELNILQYDGFVIMMAKRITKHDSSLAEMLANLRKPFVCVRARIDEDFENVNKVRKVGTHELKQDIKKEYLKKFTKVIQKYQLKEDIFLINNDNAAEWDFPRLVVAIGNMFSLHMKESFTLTQPALSASIVTEKFKELQRRTWMVACTSTLTKVFTTKKYSRRVNGERIKKRVAFYRSQLGFPEECPSGLPQIALQKFYVTNDTDIKWWLKQFNPESDYDEDDTTFISLTLALDEPYNFVNRALTVLLDKMQETSLRFFVAEDKDEAATSMESEHGNLIQNKK